MNDLRPPRRIGRSISALLIGMAAGIALTHCNGLRAARHSRFPAVGSKGAGWASGSGYDVSDGLQHRRQLPDCTARSIQAHATCIGGRSDWHGCQPGGRGCNVERRPGLRASLVSHCAGCAGIALRLGWCQDSREATTGVAGVKALYATSIAIRVTSSCRAIDGGGQRRTSASS